MHEPNKLDTKNAAKTAKKRAKAARKAEKARLKAQTATAPAAETESDSADRSLRAAERSARASERSARLTYYQVWIGIIAIIVSLIVAALAWRQHSRSRPEPATSPAVSIRNRPDYAPPPPARLASHARTASAVTPAR